MPAFARRQARTVPLPTTRMSSYIRYTLTVHGTLAHIALIVAFWFLSLANADVSAQSTRVQVTSTTTTGWPLIEATVTVVDESGQPITGLPSEAFSATLAGADLELTNLLTTSDPGLGVSIVLSFDVSGSMAGPPLENARAAAHALIAQLGPSDQVAVLAFADGPVVIQQFTADKAILGSAIDGLVAGGNTSLYAGVQESVNLANTSLLPRRAIVLLSDGVNFPDDGALAEPSLTAVEESSVLFMSIGLGDAIDQDYLSKVAGLGHGQFSVAPAPEDLTALFRTAADVLRQQYVLSLDAGLIDPQVAHNGTLAIQSVAGGSAMTGEATIELPAAVLAIPATPLATPDLAGEVEAPLLTTDEAAGSSDENSLLPYALVVAGSAAIIVLSGTLVWRRRRLVPVGQDPDPETNMLSRVHQDSTPVYFPEIQRAVITGAPGAWLEVSPGNQVALGDIPITVGFGSDCMVMLTNGSSVRTERARIWRRDGNYMLHNLSRVGGVSISGRAVTWAVLEDGDEIDIGGCKLLFRDSLATDVTKI